MRVACAPAKTRSAPRWLQALLGLSRRISRPLRAPRRRAARLDPRMLSDHLKRDLGILDGNDPSGPHP